MEERGEIKIKAHHGDAETRRRGEKSHEAETEATYCGYTRMSADYWELIFSVAW